MGVWFNGACSSNLYFFLFFFLLIHHFVIEKKDSHLTMLPVTGGENDDIFACLVTQLMRQSNSRSCRALRRKNCLLVCVFGGQRDKLVLRRSRWSQCPGFIHTINMPAYSVIAFASMLLVHEYCMLVAGKHVVTAVTRTAGATTTLVSSHIHCIWQWYILKLESASQRNPAMVMKHATNSMSVLGGIQRSVTTGTDARHIGDVQS